MLRRSARLLLVLAAVTASATLTPVATADYHPPTVLKGQFGPASDLHQAATIKKTDGGYRFIAGRQDSHLTVTARAGKLHFRDTGTRYLKGIPSSCHRQAASPGIAATCSIPAKYGPSHRMYVEIWPRLGDDYIDGSQLSSTFRFWVLSDAGRDTVLGGHGADFVNGAADADRVHGGGGNDWIRTGKGDDHVWGDAGADKLVGAEGADVLYGGTGADKLYGSGGHDVLWAASDGSHDALNCGGGRDRAHVDGGDRRRECERVGG